jgi:hypothetical protein
LYSHCIFCKEPLGANEAVAHFPVGRTLAFDAAKGRLWVVCPACARWNLSPLEERWEAIEECERAFRDTRLRVSTENVGLARLAEGMELVRVGPALRPEMAAWRYGRTLLRRGGWTHRWGLGEVTATGAAVAGIGVAVVTLPPVGLVVGALMATGLLSAAAAATMARGPAPASMGRRIVLPDGTTTADHGALVQAIVRTDRDRTAAWELVLRTQRVERTVTQTVLLPTEDHVLTGRDALHAASVVLGWANRGGGSRREVAGAVGELSRVANAADYFGRAEAAQRRRGWGYRSLWEMPPVARLAMEMATHEEGERRAMEGELAELERRWREAEAIAAVADRLALPPEVDAGIDRLRAALRRRRP